MKHVNIKKKKERKKETQPGAKVHEEKACKDFFHHGSLSLHLLHAESHLFLFTLATVSTQQRWRLNAKIFKCLERPPASLECRSRKSRLKSLFKTVYSLERTNPHTNQSYYSCVVCHCCRCWQRWFWIGRHIKPTYFALSENKLPIANCQKDHDAAEATTKFREQGEEGETRQDLGATKWTKEKDPPQRKQGVFMVVTGKANLSLFPNSCWCCETLRPEIKPVNSCSSLLHQPMHHRTTDVRVRMHVCVRARVR